MAFQRSAIQCLFLGREELSYTEESLLGITLSGEVRLKLIAQLLRLILAASVALASLSVGASEVVCVIGPHQVAVPLAKCGMSCCAHGVMNKAMCAALNQPSAATVPPCCAGKHAKSNAKRSASMCVVGGMSCRCETRLTASTPSTFIVARAATVHVHQIPAILPELLEMPELSIAIPAPEIFGTDSGPPHNAEHSPQQSRAPPLA